MYSLQFSKNFPLPKNGGHFEFSNFCQKMAKHKFASISLTMRDRAISSRFSSNRVSEQCTLGNFQGPRWQSGNTLASHLCGRGSIPVMAVSGKAGSCLPLVGSLQYTTLANSMYWFPLPFQLPVVI